MIVFENCRDYASAENCWSKEETNKFWATAGQNTFSVSLHMKQVDMKNVTHPIQNTKPPFSLAFAPGEKRWNRIELSPNEFTSHEDYFGLFGSDLD